MNLAPPLAPARALRHDGNMTRTPLAAWPAPASPIAPAHIALHAADEAPAAHDLSAIARDGDTLFLGADESATVELVYAAGGDWSGHQPVAMGEVFDLPDEADELDI